jgi:LacI family transcriptional regulator
LIFNFWWDDAKAILMGIAGYSRGTWEVMVDNQATAVAEEDDGIFSARWDGVITRHISPWLVEACRARRIPLIDLNDSPVFPDVPKIRPDNRAVGHLGAEHFLERGFKSFAFCGFTDLWARERAAGFREALGLAGKSCDTLEAEFRMNELKWEADQVGTIQKWLANLPRPLAVMACNDLRASQVVSACQKSGYLVPHEVAVLGANNDYLRCAFSSPPLSSVATDRQLAGYRAAELLDRMMVSGECLGREDIRIDPLRVVVRHSTDVLAVEDKVTCSAIHYIRQFACQGITAEDVAKHIGVSRHVLERKFRQFLGRSAHVEIRQVQIARIKQLLIETDMPLKNIADLVGIPHTEYVNVMFARQVGVTPGMYRRNHQPRNSDSRLASSTEPDFKEDA